LGLSKNRDGSIYIKKVGANERWSAPGNKERTSQKTVPHLSMQDSFGKLSGCKYVLLVH
jgi:hypothetical protein